MSPPASPPVSPPASPAVRALVAFVRDHFEAVLYGSFWMSASILGVCVHRPWIGLVGLVSVLPFLVVYVARR